MKKLILPILLISSINMFAGKQLIIRNHTQMKLNIQTIQTDININDRGYAYIAGYVGGYDIQVNPFIDFDEIDPTPNSTQFPMPPILQNNIVIYPGLTPSVPNGTCPLPSNEQNEFNYSKFDFTGHGGGNGIGPTTEVQTTFTGVTYVASHMSLPGMELLSFTYISGPQNI